MSELEEKLGTILNDPNMMQQIMGMAKILSAEQDKAVPSQTPASPADSGTSKLDPSLLSAIAGIANQSGVDSDQDCLLKALQPYLSRGRISKLERAMRAARMANVASSFLNAGGGRLLGLR